MIKKSLVPICFYNVKSKYQQGTRWRDILKFFLVLYLILFVGEVMFTLSQCSLALVKRSTLVSHLLVMLVSCEN